jgi:arsenate reductase
MRVPLWLCALTLGVLWSAASVGQTSDAPKVQRVVFVCEHGSVKSLIAASYFNRSAKARGLPFEAIARGTSPEPTVPRIVQDGLNADSLNVSGYVPLLFRRTDLSRAALVVSFDQDLAATVGRQVPLQKWDHLPSVLAEYGRGRDAIVERVNALVETLSHDRSP